MKKIHLFLFASLLIIVSSIPNEDLMAHVPGYPANYTGRVFSGYLSVGSENRSLHYVFVEAATGPNNKQPVTLWLNGGPGCSSMLGFIQQIGPYYLEDGHPYVDGDQLIENPYSWHKASNLIFLQSPAGVGFSYNLDKNYAYGDHNTARDNLQAVLSFFQKFPEYSKNRFWLAGQSYAGKYIPDLAVEIDRDNQNKTNKIDLRGIMVGNGVMTFRDNDIQKSQIKFMIDREFVDPSMLQYWRNSCEFDPESAGCQFFKTRFDQTVQQINPYNVYGYCFYNDTKFPGQDGLERTYQSQQSILMNLIRKYSNNSNANSKKYNGAPCAYFTGVSSYFNSHVKQYNAKFPSMKWNGPCAENITYNIDLSGSMYEYSYLLGRVDKYMLSLYNGDWDDVIPYEDTKRLIKKLGLSQAYIYHPWFTDNQHSGFVQIYTGIVFTTFKGASHQVPQAKRAEAFNFFNATLDGHTGSGLNATDIMLKKIRAQSQ